MSQLTIQENSRLDYFARDVVTLTANQLYSVEEICEAYGISAAQYAELCDNPVFAERMQLHENKIGTDRVSLIRAQAKLMSESHLRTLQEIASDPRSRPGDRLKAIQQLNELADVRPKTDNNNSGLVLNVSFGSLLTSIAAVADDGGGNE